MKKINEKVMLFEKVIKDFSLVKKEPEGTLYAFRFPWSFANGAKIRLVPTDKSEHIDCNVTGCYKSVTRSMDWSIEIALGKIERP